ncbi:MAG: cytochrome c [Candidatus Competibacteraceae bacterium]|jgi:cytochrome c553|nr:cytochrome c [Candidatus Competibacteraceae bacterium]
MKTINCWNLVSIGMLFATMSVAQAAGDPAAGEYKFKTCAGCHAIAGYTNVYPSYHVPRLGGQHPEYIIAALKAYQAGDRQHPTMHANAYSLSEQDMADIAAYVANFGPAEDAPPVQGNAAAGKKIAANCVACHGQDGNGPDPNFPRLAGQHEDYLLKVLQEYHQGTRNNAIMKGMVATLSEQDLADLAAFYASQPQGLTAVHE